MTMTAQSEQLRNQTLNNILDNAASRPDVPISVFAETAKQFGFPELAESFGVLDDNETSKKATTFQTALVAAKESGDDDTYKQTLSAIQQLPDAAKITGKISKQLSGGGNSSGPSQPMYDWSPVANQDESAFFAEPTFTGRTGGTKGAMPKGYEDIIRDLDPTKPGCRRPLQPPLRP